MKTSEREESLDDVTVMTSRTHETRPEARWLGDVLRRGIFYLLSLSLSLSLSLNRIEITSEISSWQPYTRLVTELEEGPVSFPTNSFEEYHFNKPWLTKFVSKAIYCH